MLTFLLSRAVPDVNVRSARILQWTRRDYFVSVDPHHRFFWDRFRIRYPHYGRVALKYDVWRDSLDNSPCPMFPAKGALIDWLSDTLGLSLGERRLLHLCVGSH